MKRFLAVLQAFLVLAIGVLNYYANAKMGMMRWLVYKNYVIEKGSLKYIFMVALFVIAMLGFYVAVKKKDKILPAASVISVLLFYFHNNYFKDARYFTTILLMVFIAIRVIELNLKEKQAL